MNNVPAVFGRLPYTHTHTRTRARAHTHMQAHTKTQNLDDKKKINLAAPYLKMEMRQQLRSSRFHICQLISHIQYFFHAFLNNKTLILDFLEHCQVVYFPGGVEDRYSCLNIYMLLYSFSPQ